MAGMAALQGAMGALSISAPGATASTSAFWGNPLATYSAAPSGVRFMVKTSPIEMRLKRWERKKCKPNSLPMLHKMHVRVGDTVQVIAGREKGKVGEVVRLYKHNSTVIVKDLNMKSKHKKGTDDEPGEIVMIEGPIHSSNMMLFSKEKNVTSRVGHKLLEDGTKVRYLKKTGEVIDSVENWAKVFKEGDSE
ncbi:hypothetical protein QYE76_035920 [Lolium multiflorum]|uniref:KOW domain-containing protein n=1 Tax=Lolium multiflorum TaxID=4521 RepID=A0AAD8R124_LOLMU|nr:50S ribosomal protein L24, chloroplastic-like [Lolium rigidum]XP_047086569.1 50S ribosomal protein L24, chloroplastic-like [Lolium rigidum]XP_051198771.1 50S ribosomal protein L24, chloroplastic [Lolium perenne]KAK1612247.1 hypothetical protein QYE76_035920 [Lolium multiflorum]